MGLMRGISAPLVTPYLPDGSIDLPRYGELARYAISNGLAGVFVGGTTGEFANLTVDERIALLEAAKSAIGDSAAIMFNITALNMVDIERMITAAEGLGVRILSLTSPYYHVYKPHMLTAYFSKIAGMVPGSLVYLYNIPGLTRNPITSDMLAQLVTQHPNVVGLKDSSMDFMTFLEYQQALGKKEFDLLTGNDAQVLTSLQAGGSGAVVAMASVVPHLVQSIWDHYFSGDHEEAYAAQCKVAALRKVARDTMPILSHKAMLSVLGFDTGPARFPYATLEVDELRRIEKTIREITK